MVIHGSSWLFIGYFIVKHGYSWLFMVSHGYSFVIHGYSLVISLLHMEIHGYSWLFMAEEWQGRGKGNGRGRGRGMAPGSSKVYNCRQLWLLEAQVCTTVVNCGS